MFRCVHLCIQPIFSREDELDYFVTILACGVDPCMSSIDPSRLTYNM